MMMKTLGLAAVALLLAGSASAQASKPNDAEIAHIAYTAGALDVTAGKQALEISTNKDVRAFAEAMVRDHTAVNEKAMALVKKLGVIPQDNPTSQALSKDAAAKLTAFAKLRGADFDKAYLANEVAFHKTVNGALSSTLIPSAQNAELKALLGTGLKLFTEHEMHAEHLTVAVR
jgi:putative membrane protein